MKSRPELRKLLHNVRSKCASLNDAAEILKGCPEERAVKMLPLMVQEARDILLCLHELGAALSKAEQSR